MVGDGELILSAFLVITPSVMNYFKADFNKKDALYDNDSIRKITSGNQTIHLRAVKKLHTPEGFEKFRRDIERVCLTNINSPVDVANKLLEQCEQVSEETGRTTACPDLLSPYCQKN